MIKWLKLLASWSHNELHCPNHEWGIYPLRGHGIREPDTVLEPLKCKNMGRWDRVCLGQSRLIILRLDTCQIRGNLPASDFRFTLTSCWCPQMDLAEISKVRPFTPFQSNGVKLWKQFELQNKTCCVLCNILLLFDTEMSTFFYYYYFFLWIDSRSSSTCWLFRFSLVRGNMGSVINWAIK